MSAGNGAEEGAGWGPCFGVFTLITIDTGTIAGGASRDQTVAFVPTSRGTKTATFRADLETITDPTRSLNGEAVAPERELVLDNGSGDPAVTRADTARLATLALGIARAGNMLRPGEDGRALHGRVSPTGSDFTVSGRLVLRCWLENYSTRFGRERDLNMPISNLVRFGFAWLVGLVALYVSDAYAQQGTNNTSSFDAVITDADLRWFMVKDSSLFQVNVNDQVTDGCWLTASETKNVVELELQRSQYHATKELTTLPPRIILNALGYQVSTGGCVVYVELRVSAFDTTVIDNDGHEITSLFYSDLYTKGTMLSGQQDTMSQRVKNTFQSLIQEFLVVLDKRVREIERQAMEDLSENRREHWKTYFDSLK